MTEQSSCSASLSLKIFSSTPLSTLVSCSCCPVSHHVPRSLTQQQVGLYDANLQVPWSVRDVSQCLLWGGRIFNHSYSWTFPGLNDATTTQWCHTGALLPQTRPREALDLLSQGMHGQTRLEWTRPSWTDIDWIWKIDGRSLALH